MSLSDVDKTILQEIVNETGKCLHAKRCLLCPFRSQCLPEFLYPYPPTETQRFSMALNILSHHLLMGDGITAEEIKDHYTGRRKS